MGIQLTKGQRIDLTKGSALRRVFLGLGWDGGDDDDGIDLDASCMLLGADKSEAEPAVYFANLQSRNRSVRHSGDNLTGEGAGDDEVIHVALDAVPPEVHHLVFVINSFSGEDFNEVRNAFCRVVDEETGRELARFDMSGSGDHTALIAARLYRHQGDWKLQAIGERTSGSMYDELLGPVQRSF